MQLLELITAGGFLGIIGVVLKSGKDNEDRITRVYKRLDEVKLDTEAKYTRKDVCQILHTQITEKLDAHSCDLREIKVAMSDIKVILGGSK